MLCTGYAEQMYTGAAHKGVRMVQRTTFRLQIHILQTGSVMDLTVTWQHQGLFIGIYK